MASDELADFRVLETTDQKLATLDVEVVRAADAAIDDALVDARVRLVTDRRDAEEIVIVREGVLSTPSDFGFTQPAAWYDAEDIVGLTSGQAVATWPDSSGNGRHMIQATGANQPTFRTGIQNGLPVVRFVGGNFLVHAAAFLNGQAGSIFGVVRPTNLIAGLQALLSSGDEASGTRFLVTWVEVLSTGRMGVGQRNNDTQDTVRSATTVLANNSPYILELHSDAALYSLVVNGTTQAKTVVGGADTGDWFGDTSARDNTILGALRTSSPVTQFFTGDMGEVLAYDAVTLSPAQKTQIRNYLNAKWAVY